MKIRIFITALSIVCIVLFASSCGPTKTVAATVPSGQSDVIRKCQGPAYKTDKDAFRATGIASSVDQQMAIDIATATAQKALAANLQLFAGKLTDAYANQHQKGTSKDLIKRFQENGQTAVKQTMSNVQVICDELVQDNATKEYTSTITVQVQKDAVYSTIKNSVIKDIDGQADAFREIYNQTMSKMDEEK